MQMQKFGYLPIKKRPPEADAFDFWVILKGLTWRLWQP